MDDEHGGKFLVNEGAAGRLYIYWEEYNGSNFLHLRYWYQDKADQVWKPGRKGIAIPEAKLPAALAGIRTMLQRSLNSGS